MKKDIRKHLIGMGITLGLVFGAAGLVAVTYDKLDGLSVIKDKDASDEDETEGMSDFQKESKKKETKDPQFVTCPRCGARIPRKKAIEWTVEDFEHDEGGDLA